MVNAWMLLVGLAAAPADATPAPVGVVQVARDAGGLEVGAVLRAGDVVGTGPAGWAEISLQGGLRARISAGTRLTLERRDDALRLAVASGRVWLQRDAVAGTVEVRVGSDTYRVAARTSAVFEQTASGGSLLAVARGRVEQGETVVDAGRVRRRRPGAPAGPVRSGGAAILALVAEEARLELDDPAGWQAFLLRRAALRGARGRKGRLGPQLRFSSDVLGSDADSEGALVEEALRPPPFFESEVPTKGPNVDVEVRFPTEVGGGS